MSVYQLGIVVVTVLIALTNAKSIEKQDIVFFPNPNGNGSMIKAQLTPTPGAKAGNSDDVHFYLYTKENPETFDELDADNPDTIDESHWIENGKVILMVHGFGAHYYHAFPYDLREEYTKADFPENYNVILMDWSILSDSPDYFTAVANAQVSSAEAVKLLELLVDSGKATWDNINLIGYSLGGQVVGQIGWKIQQLEGNPKIPRITALDPANPLFDVASDANRTTPDDADFVQVIHTACNGILGMFEPMGHADYYPNGGRAQPGCGIDPTGSCAHGRAPAMFIESVLSTVKFTGKECADYAKYQNGECDSAPTQEMGHHTPATARGVYFLNSNDKSPFAQG